MTPCINFLFKVSNWYFKIFFLQFSLLLFIKIKNVFSICVSCHPLHDISKTPNYYRVTLSIANFCRLLKYLIQMRNTFFIVSFVKEWRGQYSRLSYRLFKDIAIRFYNRICSYGKYNAIDFLYHLRGRNVNHLWFVNVFLQRFISWLFKRYFSIRWK